ncbi:serine protease [Pleurotus ostreatus]|uniref:Serine protease n=1 Tax=Pleurotus ostreatus TaxID=5322 RepID=A0A8H7DSB4_PLEOS|nr:serine protease [Pleurotus ostreatus]KAF7428899.1 serine protease [Pleurotus ostreatus]KAJ8697152.1 proteinase B [Pleurotus ostreatus]
MQPFIHWSLLAISVSTTLATPLSTSSHYEDNRQRAHITLAPLVENEHPHGSINNSYIIMFKQGVSPTLMDNHLNFLQTAQQSEDSMSGVKHAYTVGNSVHGYAGEFTAETVEQLRGMPEVDLIERDQIVHTTTPAIEKGAPWGLARISHRSKLGFSTFTKYLYDDEGGDGVDVYVIDTGININHVEFEGRAFWGKTIPQNDVDEDGNGHGTHCAGTIASRKYGVAKKANVYAVKVLGSNGSGSMSDVVAGVTWAAESALAKKDQAARELAATGKTSHKGSVASMSLGGGKSPALDRAVNAAVDSGIHFSVAAGNDNRDACNYSPAAAEKAVTVGASTLGDDRAYFSNHGPCVDVFAPGLNILSTWNSGPTAVATLSGTSMACPHVAGLLAYFLSIYPHETFAPFLDEPLVAPPTLQHAFSTPSSLYTMVHSSLPVFIRNYLPSPKLVSALVGDDAALSKKPITPAQLKKALIGLSSKGLLKDLPAETVNLLIFNNATSV